MNSFIWIHFFDALHVFTELQNGKINNATYCKNNQNMNWPMNEKTVFHHHSKRNQLLMLSTIFCYYYCCTFSFFSNGCSFSMKTIELKYQSNLECWMSICAVQNIEAIFWRRVYFLYSKKSAVVRAVIQKYCKGRERNGERIFKHNKIGC